MKPAVFLDRDGVINEENSYITNLSKLKIFPYANDCIKEMHKLGYLVIIVTNQSGVARGMMSETDVMEINEYIKKEIGVDAIYYCPHHVYGIIKSYSQSCKCRKPNVGLIEQACKDFDIDLHKSFMVGDRASDIQTGKNAKVRTVLLESGYGSTKLEQEVYPDYILEDLRDVIAILKKEQSVE